ncbi:MAG: hypothetical protein ABIC91_07715 [Nanoarchaeota archaeon]
MGRKLPKKSGYRRQLQNNSNTSKFPNCIGTYPECENYSADMKLDARPECKSCPSNK